MPIGVGIEKSQHVGTVHDRLRKILTAGGKVAKELKAEHKIEILDEATNEATEVETWTVRLTSIDGVSSHRETGVVGGLTYPTRKR